MPRPSLKFSTEPPAPGVDGTGRRIGLVRQRLALSMESMAIQLGVSAQAISDLEAGKSKYPKADLLASCATALGVRLDWLLLGQGPMLYRDEQATRRQQLASEAQYVALQARQALDALAPILSELSGAVVAPAPTADPT